jgi:DNA modification methylase
MTDKKAKPKAIKTLDDLSFDKRNANKGTALGQTMVEQSIERYGAGRSIVADKDGVVIGGNKTLQAARDQGLDVQVIRTKGEALIVHQREDLSLDEDGDARMLAYVDNRSSEVGLDWDADILKADIGDGLDLGDIFSDADLEGIGVDLGDPDEPPEAQMDAAEQLQEKWQVKDGDVWQIGGHRLMCGDSTCRETYEVLMDNKKADMLWSDPPYGVNVTGKGGNAIMGDISFTAIPLMFVRIVDHLSDTAWIYVCGGQSNIPLYTKMFEEYFRQLPRIAIWDKGSVAVMRPNGYHSCYELIFFSFKVGGGSKWFGGRGGDEADDIWHYSAPGNDRNHVTEKPVELPMRAIKNTCEKGGIILDPFAGGGSFMVAAQLCGRIGYGIEIDPKYCAVILERMSDMGLTPELVDNAREAKA